MNVQSFGERPHCSLPRTPRQGTRIRSPAIHTPKLAYVSDSRARKKWINAPTQLYDELCSPVDGRNGKQINATSKTRAAIWLSESTKACFYLYATACTAMWGCGYIRCLSQGKKLFWKRNFLLFDFSKYFPRSVHLTARREFSKTFCVDKSCWKMEWKA